MAYNPFDDVIENDPAYMANGGLPQRRNFTPSDPAEEERQRVLGELERAMAQPRPSDPTKEIRTALNPFAQPITDLQEQPIQFESKQSLAPRELGFLDKAQRKFYETLTGDFTREEAFGKEILGRQLSMAQAFAEAGRELDPSRLSVSNIELQDPVLGPLLEKYGYKRGSLAEGAEATLETFYRDQRKSLEKKDRGEELDFTEKVLASKPMFFLDSLDFTGIFGLATTGALKVGAKTLKFLNDARATGKPIEEVRQTLKTQFPEDANKIGINYHTSRQTTERFTDQDLAASQMRAAEERGMRFLKGKPSDKLPLGGAPGRQTKETIKFRKEQIQKLIDIVNQKNPDDEMLTLNQLVQKYDLKGVTFQSGRPEGAPPKLKDTVIKDLKEQIPEEYAARQTGIVIKRLKKAYPIIEKVSKNYPDGMERFEVIEELGKIFPKLSETELNQIYIGRKTVDGKMQTTFPFRQFLGEGRARSAQREMDKGLARVEQYNEFLKNNPPEGKISATQAAKNVKKITAKGDGSRYDKILAYKKANPDSAIAKYVTDPKLPAEKQLTPEVLAKLKEEFEIFDDFIPILSAVKLTGIPETTLSRAVKNNTNGVADFVQPKRSKGKLQAYINSFIPARSSTSASSLEQAEALMTVDNFRGGMFGPSKESFAKVMAEYGIIPKKIIKDGEFVDNPNYLKGDPVFEERMKNKRKEFFADQIKQLDRGKDSFEELIALIEKRDAFSKYAKEKFKNLVRTNPKLKEKFMSEYKRVLGEKNKGDFERMLNDIARAFAGNMSHVTPITRFKGRTVSKGDRFKLSPGLKGRFTNPEFYRINLSVDNIARQPRLENIIIDNIKRINKLKSFPRNQRFDILDKSLDKIAAINQQMINNNMSTFLQFSRKDLSPETMRKLIQERTLGKEALKQSKDKITLFLGKQEDMSLPELKQMFDDRLEKYRLAPELFKISKQKPKGAKIDEEMFILGSAPYIVKGFPLDFKQGGAVSMAMGGDPLQNINQQQFTPDPAIDEDFFQQAVDSGNLTAFNPTKLFKVFGKVDAVETPKKKIETDAPQGPPGTTLPAAQQMQPSDFAFKSFTLDVITDPNAPKAARPQDWMNFFKGKAAPEAELRDTGLMQFLEDFAKYYPNQKISQQRLVDFYEQSPMGNISIKVKQEGIADPEFQRFVGKPRHKNTGNQDLDEVGTNYREVVVQSGALPGETKPFVESGHFQEQNVIGFTRVADYKNANGQNVAVIQELQTDMLTKVRKEQERIQALLKRIENVKRKAEERIASGDIYENNMGQTMLRSLNNQFPSGTLQKLQENLSAIKPFPNTAGLEQVPRYAKELDDIQKQINSLVNVEIKKPSPQTPFDLEKLENQQSVILNSLLDLTRNSEVERELKGIQVPSTRETDELEFFASKSEDLNVNYGGFKDLELFPPVPFNKQPDYVDLLLKATIKDAQSKGINKVAIMPAERVNRRWGKDPDGPSGVKFNNLYDKVVPQQLKNIAKKYGGTLQIEQIIDSKKPSRGLKFFNRDVDGGLNLNKEDVARRTSLTSEEGIDEFYNEQIRKFVSGGGYRDKDVVISREVAPGQFQDFFVRADDDSINFVPLGEGDSVDNALIVIEEFNPQAVDMFTITLDSPKSQEPFFMFKKKDGGTIAKDSLVSITDIFGEYGR